MLPTSDNTQNKKDSHRVSAEIWKSHSMHRTQSVKTDTAPCFMPFPSLVDHGTVCPGGYLTYQERIVTETLLAHSDGIAAELHRLTL